MKIKLAIFDLDGTIVNTLPLYVDVYDITYKYFGFNLTRNQIITNFPIKLADQCKNIGIPEKTEEFKKIYMNNIYKIFSKAKLFDGFFDLMTFIKERNIKTAIVSFAFREYVNFILKNLNIKDYFDMTLSFDEVKNPKPDPEAVLLVARTFDILPLEILVIGDAESDMLMGNNAKVKTCLFYPKENKKIYPEEKVKKIVSDFRINSLKELIRLFK